MDHPFALQMWLMFALAVILIFTTAGVVLKIWHDKSKAGSISLAELSEVVAATVSATLKASTSDRQRPPTGRLTPPAPPQAASENTVEGGHAPALYGDGVRE